MKNKNSSGTNNEPKYVDKIVLVTNNTSHWLNEVNEKYLDKGWNVMQIGNASCGTAGSVYGCFVWIRKKID